MFDYIHLSIPQLDFTREWAEKGTPNPKGSQFEHIKKSLGKNVYLDSFHLRGFIWMATTHTHTHTGKQVSLLTARTWASTWWIMISNEWIITCGQNWKFRSVWTATTFKSKFRRVNNLQNNKYSLYIWLPKQNHSTPINY